MNDWVNRVKERMKLLNMSRETLAQNMGLTYGAITHYLTGRRVPPLSQFHKLAQILKTDAAWLHYGEEDRSLMIGSNTITSEHKYSVPIMSYSELARHGVNGTDSTLTPSEFIPNLFSDQPHWIALRVLGDAMSAPLGNLKTFIEGSIIIVDSKKDVADGCYVVAVLADSKEITFKQYVIDSGITYLKPLNPQYPMVKLENESRIYGVVIWSLNQFN